MGIYDRFKAADPMGARQYILEGNHTLLIKRTEMGASKNPLKKGTERTVVEFKVMKSDTLKIGTMCALVEVDTSAGYFGNVLSFAAGVLGLTIDEMKRDESFDAVFDGAFGQAQLFTDTLVRCIAQQTPTKAGGVYTAKSWEPVKSSEYGEYGLIAPDGAYTGQ